MGDLSRGVDALLRTRALGRALAGLPEPGPVPKRTGPAAGGVGAAMRVKHVLSHAGAHSPTHTHTKCTHAHARTHTNARARAHAHPHTHIPSTLAGLGAAAADGGGDNGACCSAGRFAPWCSRHGYMRASERASACAVLRLPRARVRARALARVRSPGRAQPGVQVGERASALASGEGNPGRRRSSPPPQPNPPPNKAECVTRTRRVRAARAAKGEVP